MSVSDDDREPIRRMQLARIRKRVSMRKRCKHQVAFDHLARDVGEDIDMEYRRCCTCGTWLPLGNSNETPVAIEVRAAELYACANHCADVQDDDCHCYRPSRLLRDPHDEAKARRLYREMWEG